jgi:hypothetical protein
MASEQSLERRLRVSEKLKGVPFSPERIKKIKDARARQIMMPCSEEKKAKISASHIARHNRIKSESLNPGKDVNNDIVQHDD